MICRERAGAPSATSNAHRGDLQAVPIQGLSEQVVGLVKLVEDVKLEEGDEAIDEARAPLLEMQTKMQERVAKS